MSARHYARMGEVWREERIQSCRVKFVYSGIGYVRSWNGMTSRLAEYVNYNTMSGDWTSSDW